MKPICLVLLVFFYITGWSQENANEDYEILRITNFAGQTGMKNAVKINFPGKVELSRIVFSYSFKKFTDSPPEYDTIFFSNFFDVNKKIPKSKRLRYKKGTLTKTELNVLRTESTLQIYIEELDNQKNKASFDWGVIGQPKIYPYKKQNHTKRRKRKFNKWLLKEVTIYAKKLPDWFDKKDPETPYPRMSIENLLLGFPDKKMSKDRIVNNNGIAPQLIISNLREVKSFKVIEPSSAEMANCSDMKYKFEDKEYSDTEFEKLFTIDEGSDILNIEFFNARGKYEEDYVTCKPMIELMFFIPNKVIPPPLEVVDYGWRVWDTTITTVERTDPVKTKEEGCKCGTKGGGSVEITFNPQQRQTKIYKNIQYIIKNNSANEIIPVIQIEPVYELTQTDTAYITDVEIKLRHQSEKSYWNLEKNPRYQRALYKKTGNRQINLDSLDSGIYDLKVSWKLKGIDIDTTIKTFSGDIDYSKKIDSIIHVYKKIDSITYVHSIPFTITPGGNCDAKFTLQGIPKDPKCLSFKDHKGCSKSILIDPNQESSRYLLIGLDKEDIGRYELNKIINSNVYGQPEDFTIKPINCIDCQKYEKNDVLWNGAKINQHIVIDLDKLGRKKPIVLRADILENDGPLDVFYQFISVSSEK